MKRKNASETEGRWRCTDCGIEGWDTPGASLEGHRCAQPSAVELERGEARAAMRRRRVILSLSPDEAQAIAEALGSGLTGDRGDALALFGNARIVAAARRVDAMLSDGGNVRLTRRIFDGIAAATSNVLAGPGDGECEADWDKIQEAFDWANSMRGQDVRAGGARPASAAAYPADRPSSAGKGARGKGARRRLRA